MDFTVIITAGGIGKRMGGELPKQFLSLNDKPILQHTIDAFSAYDKNAQLIVTLPEQWIAYWKELCVKNNFTIAHEIISGGKERFHSVKNALNEAVGKKVLIHDGVRPLVSAKVINDVLVQITEENGVVPTVSLKSSLRKGSPNHNHAVDRSEFWEVQTPQGFMRETLVKAYAQKFSSEITDDASLVEKSGKSIQMVAGDYANIKITTPIDMIIGSKLLSD
jgi:2-C-methyl-D-erythritol 4-phosphate cytidylyltransferase